MSAFGCDPMFLRHPSSSFKKQLGMVPLMPPLPQELASQAEAAAADWHHRYYYEEAFRLCCRGSEDLSLAVRDGLLRLVNTNILDVLQRWVQDKGYYASFNKINNQEGHPDPPFVLVNVGTGHEIARHRDTHGNYHVSLLPSFASVGYLDTSVLWESTDEGTRRGGRNGFRCIRSAKEAEMPMPMYMAFDSAGDGGVVLRRKPAKRGNSSFSYEWKMVSC